MTIVLIFAFFSFVTGEDFSCWFGLAFVDKCTYYLRVKINSASYVYVFPLFMIIIKRQMDLQVTWMLMEL